MLDVHGHRTPRLLPWLAMLSALVVPPAPAAAQSAVPGAPGAVETRHLKLSTAASVRSARPGGRVLLFVDVAPKSNMHVYAPEQKDYIPIQLTLVPDEHVRALPAKYPRAEKFFFAPLEETQRVYSRPFRIAQPIALSGSAPEGELTIKGTVRYQACDDAICYLPQEIAVSWTVSVGPLTGGR
jgi:DsbC/DsbD-like thiol-disulfide interchange protein